MRKQLASIVLSVPILMCGSAFAQEVSGNVALTTNYIFRGVSQTDDGPAVSGGFDFGSDSFYAGAWGSSVDFGDDTTMELDLYAGFTPSAAGWDFDFGGIYYLYPDSPQSPSQDFFEAYAGASRGFDALTWDIKLSYSPDFYLEVGSAYYLESGLALQLNDAVSIDVRAAASRFNDLSSADYEDYQIGATFSGGGLDYDVRYHDVSAGDSAFVFTVSRAM